MEINNEIKAFIKDYVQNLHQSSASIFVGAGLSKGVGYVSWKQLLRDVADDLQLDIEKEDDLISIAQYHVNEYSRNKINETIVGEFTKNTCESENHRILMRLPIQTIWTTNYDKIIEDTYRKYGKNPDTKITTKSISNNLPNRDVIVYKIHGDVSDVDNAVITKDDYDMFDTTRGLFVEALKGELATKTFMFLGYSFNDPNLSYIISKLAFLLANSKRIHYCFFKKLSLNDFDDNEEELRYNLIKQELKIKDLKRYGIKTILIEEHSDVTEILKILERQYKAKNIFVSGSAYEYGAYTEDKSMSFASNLSKELIKIEKNIVSGFGSGIGSFIISSALEAIYALESGSVDNRLKLRPFPQDIKDESKRKELFTRYREDMLLNVGISIFMFGNKLDTRSGDIIFANGMREEFDISIEKGSIPIPVGAFGYMAKELWKIVMNDFDKYVPLSELKPYYEIIGDEKTSVEDILKSVIRIVELLSVIK